MRLSRLQKKWKRIAEEPGWESVSPEVHEQIKARNARWKAETAVKAEKEAKDGKINMRVPSGDLEQLKAVAEKKGVGYQTLLGMIIHQYVNGTLVDIEEIKKILKVG